MMLFLSQMRRPMGRVKRIWYLSLMRAAKVQASLRIRAVSPEPSLLAHTSSESRGTFRQKARSLAPLNGWACAVKICHDRMLEDTNSLDGAHMINLAIAPPDLPLPCVGDFKYTENIDTWIGSYTSICFLLQQKFETVSNRLKELQTLLNDSGVEVKALQPAHQEAKAAVQEQKKATRTAHVRFPYPYN